MKPLIRSLLLVIVLSAGLLALPAGAALVLSDVAVQPNTYPLAPMSAVNVTAHVTLEPLGTTTFRDGHRLQMQTGLLNATWDTRVYIDGAPGARQPASGTSAFINGYLLSFESERDVSLLVTVRGTVPDTPGQQALLIRISELDSTGSLETTVTPITISEPVAIPVTTTTTKRTVRATTPPAEETATAPTDAGAGGEIPVIALCAAAVLVSWGGKNWKKR